MPQEQKQIYGKGAEYPAGLSNIGYASYLEITKYRYNAGLKAAWANGQRDVAASMGQNGFVQGAKKLVNQGGQAVFGGTDVTDYNTEKLEADLSKALSKDDNFFSAFNPNKKKRLQNVMDGDYTHLFKDGQPITLSNGEVIENAEQLKQIKKEAKQAIGNDSSIFNLPMPQEFSYGYNADWSNEFKMGTMARIMDDLGGGLAQMATTGTATALTNVASALTGATVDGIEESTGLSGIQNQLGSIFSGATNPLGSTDELNVNRILGVAGLAPNENAIALFKKIQNRKFNFTFDFFARDEQESLNIDEIIYAFKGGMHPSTTMKGTGGVLGFPDLFTIKPMFVKVIEGGGIEKIKHPMMPKSKLCALVDLQVNTTPSNNFVTTKEGKIPLQSVTMMFEETTAMTQSDIKVGDF